MVSVTVDQPRHRQNNKVFASRCRKWQRRWNHWGLNLVIGLALSLERFSTHGALLCSFWCWYGLPHHNPKLFPEQVAYIINHADDKILFVDVLVCHY
ncbi:MAG: hypothetical protein Ct9H90mP25_3310 [Gammaproteobacteria bacterium]|nr:MAG: hypothetical protein Ct9H90mP25_3310 [Gammaproteobacteria bacterium]